MTPSISDAEARDLVGQHPHWYHRIEVRPGLVTPGINDSPAHLRAIGLPGDCTGLRVLDIGTRDGFFAFELERRGADVLAVDYMAAEQTGFAIAARLLDSRVQYRRANVYDLDAADLGTFDIVLFLGVLYHLPDPVRALRIVRTLCHKRMYLETLVIDSGLLLADGSRTPLSGIDERLLSVPLMQFFPGRSCNDDPTNFWGPNVRCVEAMLEATEFTVTHAERTGDRAVFTCDAISQPRTGHYLAIASGLKAP